MKPRLVACGLALILALSICLPAVLATADAEASSSTDDNSDYHYDDEYDDEYDDSYGDQDQDPGPLDSDKSSEPAEASTGSPVTTTTTSTTTTTTAAPLWSDEEDVREDDYLCPRDCSCEDGTKFLNCSQRSLVDVPTDLPRNVIRLDLSGNNIKRIPVEAFQNCTEVREIWMDRNVIEELDREVFMNLAHLDALGLAGNQLSHLAKDSFAEAQSLRRLVLSENPLVMPDEGPFLEQEDLEELELARCNLTELTRDAFSGMSALKWLNLAGNEFDEDISTDVFEPLENLQRLNMPPLSEDTVRELCDVVKSIDVVDITTHNVSCFYLASETSYEESIITQRPITPEPKRVPVEDSEDSEPNRPSKVNQKLKVPETENDVDYSDQEQSSRTPAPPAKPTLPVRKSTSTTTTSTTTIAAPTVSGPASASITHSADDPSGSKDDVKKETNPDKDNHSLLASISSDTMKQLLMGIIGVALLILMIGIICRQTGLKNKLCGSKRRPAPTDQVRPAEEVPLNKV